MPTLRRSRAASEAGARGPKRCADTALPSGCTLRSSRPAAHRFRSSVGRPQCRSSSRPDGRSARAAGRSCPRTCGLRARGPAWLPPCMPTRRDASSPLRITMRSGSVHLRSAGWLETRASRSNASSPSPDVSGAPTDRRRERMDLIGCREPQRTCSTSVGTERSRTLCAAEGHPTDQPASTSGRRAWSHRTQVCGAEPPGGPVRGASSSN